ncbi:hypothetical protein EV424DRAFT_1384674 [Suillus variegatus]|nr:hypothetical protein EV424DRAFT_1384674 [Suillus variegatus]
MATSPSSSHSVGDALSRPIALVVSDLKLPDDGSVNVRLTPVFWVRLQFVDQFRWAIFCQSLLVLATSLTILRPSLRNNTSKLCVLILSVSCWWVARMDLSCVHVCNHDYAPNLIVFKHLKVARCDLSRLILPVPYAIDIALSGPSILVLMALNVCKDGLSMPNSFL